MNEPYKLPDGWKWVRLGEVCEIFSGSSAPQEKKYFDNGKHPFVRVQDLGRYGRTVNLVDIKDYINDIAIAELNMIKAEKGTILFPKSGAAILTNNRAILGRDAFIVSHLAAVRAKKELLDNYFVFHWLCLVDMGKYMENPGYPSLKLSTISKIFIPLPPIETQHRIAVKLQELMQDLERAGEACEKQLEAVKALPSAYLREVFESEEAKKWERKRLGEVCEIIKGKKPQIYTEKINENYLPYLTAEVIRINVQPKWCLKIDPNAVEVSKSEIILIADGSNSGEVFTGFEGILASTMGKLKIKVDSISKDYLYFFIKMNFKELNVPKRGSAIPHLEKDIFYHLQIPLPPIETQHRVVSYLKEKMAYVEKLSTEIEKQLEAINALPQAILKKAFRGEL